jgi:hypothetical protein
MLLEMSEIERALIQEHQLKNIIIEDIPRFSESELQSIADNYEREVAATKDVYLKVTKEATTQAALAALKQDRLQTRLGDYLVFPHSRDFKTPHEAKLYADKLKTTILPAIRSLIDSYKDSTSAQTIEF